MSDDARELAKRLRGYSEYLNIAPGQGKGASTFRQAADLLESLAAENERLRKFLGEIATAPDTQVSGFIRAACVAVLDGGTNTLPPGDPYKAQAARIAELETLVSQLKTEVKWLQVRAIQAEERAAELERVQESLLNRIDAEMDATSEAQCREAALLSELDAAREEIDRLKALVAEADYLLKRAVSAIENEDWRLDWNERRDAWLASQTKD